MNQVRLSTVLFAKVLLAKTLLVTAALTAAPQATGSAQAAGCFAAPYSCMPGTDVDPATAPDYQSQYLAYAGLVWQDFLSLNFPAATDGSGRPLPQPSSTNGLNYAGGEYTPVWQTWSEATDLFQPGAAVPPPFGGGHILPNACAQLREGALPVLRRVGTQVVTDIPVLSEYIQANRMGPVVDKQGDYVRYGLNFNGPMHDYIVQHKLYSVEGQLVLDANNPNRDKLTVHFPKGAYQTQTGSIFVKSSWKILTEADNERAFFRTPAYVYEEAGGAFHDEPTVKERCRLLMVGLVGFHIVHFTNSAPAWVWATFEHKDNAPWLADFSQPLRPQPYTFFDQQTCPPSSGLPSCTFGVLPKQPWNPEIPGQIPTQLVRFAAPGEGAIRANNAYRTQLQQAYGTTVWSNYFLTDVQFPTNTQATGTAGVKEINPAYPDALPSPSFLANSTMETYIQGFHFGQSTTNGNQIPVDDQMVSNGSPPVDPWSVPPAVFNRSGGSERVSSSCVSCHADAAMTTGSSGNFVFSLNRAQKTTTTGAPR